MPVRADDPAGRSDLTGPAGNRQLSWLGLLGVCLVLALLAVALVQARQFTLLRATLQPASDISVVGLAETESQYLRLREQWRAAVDDRSPWPPDLSHLRQHFDAWSASIARMREAPVSGPTPFDDRLRAVLDQCDDFAQRADRALGAVARGQADRSALAALSVALDALDDPLRLQADGSQLRLLNQLDQRSQAVRSQTRLGLGLTIFLSVLTMAFAAIALRQVRQLRERRTALEELAAHLRQARQEAEAASQAKSAFLANMSHEIRTPFHGLMGMLSLLREAGLTPRQVDYLRTATESADHLLALLNDILDVSQLESGRMSLTPTAVDVRALLRDVEALMRPQAAAKSLALHIDADPAVPERVLIDPTRVRQIVFNLLSNAIKFSDQGAVVLDVRVQPGSRTSDASAQLEFIVTDTGIGIDEALQSRLFSRFTQGDSSPSRRHGGSGLGLEISRSLARLMGGDITLRSKPGEGSCFTFSMPLRRAQTPAAAAPPGSPGDLRSARSLRVLVAEDHPVNRQYMAALLETLGHRGHFVANGEEALKAAQGQSFDVVLMDLHMPELDGVGATRAIRALPDPARSTVPIVALTADASAEMRDRCAVAGMNDFLTKPVSPQLLSACLRRLFGTAGPALSERPHEAPVAAPADGASRVLIDPEALAMSMQALSGPRLAALIEAFLDQGPETVQRLRAAVRDAQPLDLRVHAHAAKGAALNLGLTGLAQTAQALQDGAAHLPAHEIARLVQRFEEQLPATRSAARAALQSSAPADAAVRQ